jgi:hypothetical protein
LFRAEFPAESLSESSSGELLLKYLRALLYREVQLETFLKAQRSAIRRNLERQEVQIDAMDAAVDAVKDQLVRLVGNADEYRVSPEFYCSQP